MTKKEIALSAFVILGAAGVGAGGAVLWPWLQEQYAIQACAKAGLSWDFAQKTCPPAP